MPLQAGLSHLVFTLNLGQTCQQIVNQPHKPHDWQRSDCDHFSLPSQHTISRAILAQTNKTRIRKTRLAISTLSVTAESRLILRESFNAYPDG
ncbi:MAG: hypothetical protein Tsb002_07760 [Wenzhouxiangellaceae bacterium]